MTSSDSSGHSADCSTGYATDIVIFGGGVAGLWLLDRLVARGYRVILLERGGLGGWQSINSQGIIHGGLKYALQGVLARASRATLDMPQRWRECIAGRGELDLSGCRILSENFHLWSGSGLASGLKTLLGSKMLAGKAELLAKENVPVPLQGRGPVYRLADFVIDTASLAEVLAAPHGARIRAIRQAESDSQAIGPRPGSAQEQAGQWEFLGFRQGAGVRELLLRVAGETFAIKARRYVFCAGEGNERLIEQARLRTPRSQRRPLKMVAATGLGLPPMFLHVLGEGLRATPQLTITSHRDCEGAPVWYLGGDLAESGVARSDQQQIAAAAGLLEKLFPGVAPGGLQWRCLDIDRAEPASADGRRPDNATVVSEEDVLVAWPVKLTLAPALADQVEQRLHEAGVAPRQDSPPPVPEEPLQRANGSPASKSDAMPSCATAAPTLTRPFWS